MDVEVSAFLADTQMRTLNQFVRGSTAAEINRVVRSARAIAVQIAPESDNTNRPAGHRSIKGSHFTELATSANLEGVLGNRAPHSTIVHEGRPGISVEGDRRMVWFSTGGTTSQRGGARAASTFGRTQGKFNPGKRVARSVSAADAQPWIIIAYNRAVRRRRATRTLSLMSEDRTPLF